MAAMISAAVRCRVDPMVALRIALRKIARNYSSEQSWANIWGFGEHSPLLLPNDGLFGNNRSDFLETGRSPRKRTPWHCDTEVTLAPV